MSGSLFVSPMAMNSEINATVTMGSDAQPTRVWIDELTFIRDYQPQENQQGTSGFVVEDIDYLHQPNEKFAMNTEDEFIWSMVEDDSGEALIVSGRCANALGIFITKQPCERGKQIIIELDGL